MTRPVCNLCDPANCPGDLCCYGEGCCQPPAPGDNRIALRALGLAATALGLAGAVLPVVPTTPFLLVAAWAFARSSPRLEAWLRDHPRLGPPLREWEARRAIPGARAGMASISSSGTSTTCARALWAWAGAWSFRVGRGCCCACWGRCALWAWEAGGLPVGVPRLCAFGRAAGVVARGLDLKKLPNIRCLRGGRPRSVHDADRLCQAEDLWLLRLR